MNAPSRQVYDSFEGWARRYEDVMGVRPRSTKGDVTTGEFWYPGWGWHCPFDWKEEQRVDGGVGNP